jgi:hypothetical protein
LPTSTTDTDDRAVFEEERRAALDHLDDAWEEAATEGIAPECVAHAALFRSLAEFVASYGEEATAAFAERLPDRIKRGEFTLERSMH